MRALSPVPSIGELGMFVVLEGAWLFHYLWQTRVLTESQEMEGLNLMVYFYFCPL